MVDSKVEKAGPNRTWESFEDQKICLAFEVPDDFLPEW